MAGKKWQKIILCGLPVLAAAALMTGAFLMPVFQIHGNSMAPTLNKGEIVAAVRGTKWQPGDIIAFDYNNKILIKRLVAGPGSLVDIDDAGRVYVDGGQLKEPYLTEPVGGKGSLELPCRVPDGHYFVLGDCRSVLMDTRSGEIGCVAKEQVIGRIVFRIWPISRLGPVQ